MDTAALTAVAATIFSVGLRVWVDVVVLALLVLFVAAASAI